MLPDACVANQIYQKDCTVSKATTFTAQINLILSLSGSSILKDYVKIHRKNHCQKKIQLNFCSISNLLSINCLIENEFGIKKILSFYNVEQL